MLGEVLGQEAWARAERLEEGMDGVGGVNEGACGVRWSGRGLSSWEWWGWSRGRGCRGSGDKWGGGGCGNRG